MCRVGSPHLRQGIDRTVFRFGGAGWVGAGAGAHGGGGMRACVGSRFGAVGAGRRGGLGRGRGW